MICRVSIYLYPAFTSTQKIRMKSVERGKKYIFKAIQMPMQSKDIPKYLLLFLYPYFHTSFSWNVSAEASCVSVSARISISGASVFHFHAAYVVGWNKFGFESVSDHGITIYFKTLHATTIL